MLITVNPTFDIETGQLLAHEGQYEYSGPLELCIKAAERAAHSAANTAVSTAAGFGAEAGDIGSMLVPELTREALHPTGFSPADTNAMLVAGEQGAGGANAGIAGEVGLRTARSRNNASLSSVLDEANREQARTLSQNALGVQANNAALKEKQRQSGLSGLEGIRSGDIHADLEAQGLVPQDIKAWTDASKTGWLQNTLGVIDTLTGAGKAAFPKGLQG